MAPKTLDDIRHNGSESGDRSYMPTPEQYLHGVAGEDRGGSRSAPQGSQTPRKKRSRVHTIFRWTGRFILLVVLAIIVYAGYLVHSVAKISTQPVSFTGLSADASGRTNVLILGVGDPGHAGQNLSDTIMVLSLNTKTQQVAQISVPRDLRVDIPGYGAAKINAANADGGPGLAEQTVSNTLGIPINYYVKTDFTGLSEIVDAVGGIDVDVQQELEDPEYPCANNQYKVCGLDIRPGLQHMNGALALEYVRCRKGTCGNDFGRAARQQVVLNLVRKKILTWQVLLDPTKLQKIVAAVRDNVQTDLGAVQMAEFARDWEQSQSHNPVQLVFSTAPGGYLSPAAGSTDLLPIGGNFSAIQQKVQHIFGN